MNSEGLDAPARKRIEKNLRLMQSYLDKLTGRMHQKMFPRDDPLWIAGDAAREKVTKLHAVAKRLADEAELPPNPSAAMFPPTPPSDPNAPPLKKWPKRRRPKSKPPPA